MGPVSKKAENHGVKCVSSGMSHAAALLANPGSMVLIAQQWYVATLVLYTL